LGDRLGLPAQDAELVPERQRGGGFGLELLHLPREPADTSLAPAVDRDQCKDDRRHTGDRGEPEVAAAARANPGAQLVRQQGVVELASDSERRTIGRQEWWGYRRRSRQRLERRSRCVRRQRPSAIIAPGCEVDVPG